MVLIDMEKPQSCEECRFCEYEQGYCTALPVGEWRRITDMSECPLMEQKTGKWEIKYSKHGVIFPICSNCDYASTSWVRTKYCPNCGVKMEVDDA